MPDFWGSVVVLLYLLVVDPCLPGCFSRRKNDPCPGYFPVTKPTSSTQRCFSLKATLDTTPFPVSPPSKTSTLDGLELGDKIHQEERPPQRVPDQYQYRLRRDWWFRSVLTTSCTLALVLFDDAEMTVVVAVMLLGAYIPAMPRLSRKAAWCCLGVAAYLGAFQYDRAMYFSSSTRRLLLQQRVEITAVGGPNNGIGAPSLSSTTHTLSIPTPTAAVPAAPMRPRHPVTFLIGGNFRAKSLFNAAGAVLAVLSIVHSGVGERVFTSSLAMFLERVSFPVYLIHFQVLRSLGAGLFLWLQQTIVGSFAASSSLSLAIVFVVYICTMFALASTVFLQVDRKAVAISRAFAVRIVR